MRGGPSCIIVQHYVLQHSHIVYLDILYNTDPFFTSINLVYTFVKGDYELGDLLGGGRYRVLEVLGRGSNGTTYKVNAVWCCKIYAYSVQQRM